MRTHYEQQHEQNHQQLTFVESEYPLLAHRLLRTVPCSFVKRVFSRLGLKSDLKNDVWRLRGAHSLLGWLRLVSQVLG